MATQKTLISGYYSHVRSRVHHKGLATAMSADTSQESQVLLSHQEYWVPECLTFAITLTMPAA